MDVNLTNEDYYLLTAEKKLRKIIEEEKCKNKLALLWGEAQKKIAYSYLKVT